jgi:hypothetical protein
MQTIKLTREEAEKLAKYIQEKKQVKLEHEQAEFETYLIRLETILEKYNISKYNSSKDDVDVDVTEYSAFETYKRGL